MVANGSNVAHCDRWRGNVTVEEEASNNWKRRPADAQHSRDGRIGKVQNLGAVRLGAPGSELGDMGLI